MTGIHGAMMTPSGQLGWSSSAVCAETGATYRQVDYWARTGWLPDNAGGSGSSRTFSRRDLETVRAVVALTRLGVDVGSAFHMAHSIVSHGRYSARIGGGRFRITLVDLRALDGADDWDARQAVTA